MDGLKGDDVIENLPSFAVDLMFQLKVRGWKPPRCAPSPHNFALGWMDREPCFYIVLHPEGFAAYIGDRLFMSGGLAPIHPDFRLVGTLLHHKLAALGLHYFVTAPQWEWKMRFISYYN